MTKDPVKKMNKLLFIKLGHAVLIYLFALIPDRLR